MAQDPGQSFKCGPYAVDRIRRAGTPDMELHERVQAFQTTPLGTNLVQVRDLGREIGVRLRVVKGEARADMPLPAVVHWKLNHFSALMKIEGDRCLLQDNTMDVYNGREEWIPLAALQEESSGYFAVVGEDVPKGFAEVEDDEAAFIYGRGDTGTSVDPRANTDCDHQSGSGDCDKGMTRYSLHTMLVSLRLSDTPLFYSVPRGGEIAFHVTYNEKEATQPTVFTYSNLGTRWSLGWIDYITDNPTLDLSALERAIGGGGGYKYTMTAGTSAPQPYSGTVLKKTSASSYEITHRDGTRQMYGQVDGVSYPRRLFLTSIIDPSGNTTQIQYQQVSGVGLRLTGIVDPLGQLSTFSYTHADPLKITQITDPFGRSAQFSYNASGKLESITDAIGMVSSFTYGSGDTVSALNTPYGTTTFTRGVGSSSQRWIEAKDPVGDTERLEFRQSAPGIIGRAAPTPEAQDLGFYGQYFFYRNSYYWDKKAYKQAAGDYTKAMIYHFNHGDNGTSRLLEAVKKPFEEVDWFQYPGQSSSDGDYGITCAQPRLIARLMDDGTTQRVRRTYSPSSQLLSSKDALGRTTEYTYHANGIDLLEIKQRIDASTTQTLATATYNAAHLPLTMTDAAGRTTTTTYNGFGQVETILNAKNELTRLVYDANGFLTTIRDPLLGDRTIEYDGYARPRKITDVDGHFTTTDYDGLNRPLRVTYPDNSFEQIIYNRLDTEWLRDRQGRWTHQFHSALGRLVASRDSLGRMSLIDWCSCGKPAALIDALGRKTSWLLDVQGRVTGKTYPDGRGMTMTYEPKSGRLATVADALGQVTTYTYYPDNQVQQVSYNSALTGRTTPSVSFTYDAIFGRPATMTDGTGLTTYAYHPITSAPATLGAGRLASIDGPLVNDTVAFAYDELGRGLNRTLGLGATAGTYAQGVTYDNLGRVVTQANELGSFAYTYVGKTGRLNDVTLPGGMKTTLAYQAMNQDFRLSGITHTRSGGALISSHAYTYSPAGAITSWAMQTDVDGSSTFQFGNDETDQLVSAVRTGTIPTGAPAVSAFRYDAAGNRTTTQLDKVVQTHAYNNLNQLTGTTAGGLLRVEGHLDELATVTVNGVNAKVTADKKYVAEVPVATGNTTITVRATDANSNVAQKQWQVTGITGTAATPAYDFNGNTMNDGTWTFEWDAKDRVTAIIIGTQRSEFTYDGLGRRVRIVEKAGGTVTSDKRFVWVGAQIAQERDSANAVTKRFSGHGVLGANGVLLYMRDHLGSVREVMDTAGVVRARYDYEVYGKRLKVRGDLEVDAGYTGHWQHVASGLTLTWFRAYDPRTGRWLSRDPIGMRGGINLYAYVGNSPIRFVDRLGLDPTGLAIGGIIGDWVGAILGGTLGGAAGTVVGGAVGSSVPVAGTATGAVVGCSVGRKIGATAGAAAGAGIGGWLGDNVGDLINWATGGERTPEAYDSPADAIGASDGVADFVPGTKQATKNPTLQANGYSERWVVQDSAGNFHHVAYNPQTGKCTGGSGSSHE